jgi:hypothetical protein
LNPNDSLDSRSFETDTQHKNLVAFAARAFRAVFGVPHCALQQRTAQQLAGDWQFADQLVARTQGLLESFTRMKHEQTPVSTHNSSELADFCLQEDSGTGKTRSNFAPGSS